MRQATHSLDDRMRVITIIMVAGVFPICTAQDLPNLNHFPQLSAAVSAMPVGRDLQQNGSRRLALVIGNDRYRTAPALHNAVADARAIYTALTADGFTATLALDVDLRRLDLALDGFVSRLRPGDVALLYYSGHGLQIDGENYLIPTDFSAASESEAKYAAYSASRAVQQIADRNTKLNVIILDACRDNPFRFSARSLRRGWAPMDTGRGTYIAFATGPGSTASDGPPGTNGLFTRQLLNALRISGLGLDDVFARVREAVYADSGAQQIPWSASSVIGDFVFTKGGASLPELANQTGSADLTSAKPDASRRGLYPIPTSPEPLANTAATHIQSGDYQSGDRRVYAATEQLTRCRFVSRARSGPAARPAI